MIQQKNRVLAELSFKGKELYIITIGYRNWSQGSLRLEGGLKVSKSSQSLNITVISMTLKN